MKKIIPCYLISLICALLLQNITDSVASQNSSGMLANEAEKNMGKLSIQDHRDSDTSNETVIEDEMLDHQPSVAKEIYDRACAIIPGLGNLELIKPNADDVRELGRYSLAYSKKEGNYNQVKMLHDFFIDAIGHDNEAKIHVALWLLKGETIKGICKDFYENYGIISPAKGKELLLSQIKQLLNECLEYLGSSEETGEVEFTLSLLDQYVSKW